jgi:hypothetical protein
MKRTALSIFLALIHIYSIAYGALEPTPCAPHKHPTISPLGQTISCALTSTRERNHLNCESFPGLPSEHYCCHTEEDTNAYGWAREQKLLLFKFTCGENTKLKEN